MTPELKGFLLVASVKMALVFGVIMVGVILIVWVERRGSGFMQDRLGPNRVGPQGLLQSVADGLKNFFKEEVRPAGADTLLFFLAPAMAFIPAVLAVAVIPWGAPLPLSFDFSLPLLGRLVHEGVTPLMIADLPVGFLYILAFGSLAVYGVTLAGWSSNSKYSFLGGIRSSAQMISYEIPLAMSLIVLLILVGNVTLSEVVAAQQRSVWFLFPLTLAFITYFVSGVAETNRLPFDLPETETELVAGYHTEYSSMKFSMFYLSEYTHLMTQSALFATFFFGGWDVPFTSWDEGEPTVLKSLVTLAAFMAKSLFFVWVYVWLRWTLPRFRFDQLMDLGWKVILPVVLAYIVIIATTVWVLESAGVAFESWRYSLTLFAVNVVLLAAFLWGLDRNRVVAGAHRREQGRLTV